MSILSLLRRFKLSPKICIERDMLVARRLADRNGFTWTAASRLGEALALAEEMFGSRDLTYTLLGIELTQEQSQIWFPGNHSHIIIQINLNTLKSDIDFVSILAHECIHLLAPVKRGQVTVLEEGLAVFFAQHYVSMHTGKEPLSPGALPKNYQSAFEQVSELLTYDNAIIRKVRSVEPVISNIKACQLQHASTLIPDPLAEAVTRHFEE